jgi:hypothetical protein
MLQHLSEATLLQRKQQRSAALTQSQQPAPPFPAAQQSEYFILQNR